MAEKDRVIGIIWEIGEIGNIYIKLRNAERSLKKRRQRMIPYFCFTDNDVIVLVIVAILLMAAIILAFAARKYPKIFWR